MKADLQGERLLQHLSDVALAVHGARTFDGVLETTAAELRGIGVSLVVVEWRPEDMVLRHHNLVLPAEVAARLGPPPWVVGSRAITSDRLPLRLAEAAGRPLYFDDLAERLAPHYQKVLPTRSDGLLHGLLAMGFTRAVVAPVRLRGVAWGGLLLTWPGISREDAFAVGLFALQFGTALEAADTIERLEARNRELEATHELAVAGPNQSPDGLADLLLRTLSRVTQSDAGAVYRYDPEPKELVLLGRGLGLHPGWEAPWQRFPAPHWMSGLAMPMALAVAALPDHAEEVAQLGMKHVALAPLVVEGRPVGLITLGRRADAAYGAAELQVIERMSAQAAAFFERARLYEDVSRRVRQLSLLYDVAHTGTTHRELQTLVDRLLGRVVETFPADVASVHFLAGSELVLAGWKRLAGDSTEPPTQASMPIDANSVVGLAGLGRRLVARSAPNFPEYTRVNAARQGVTQLMSAPLEAGGKLLGCLSVARRSTEFNREDRALLESVSAQMAVLVEQIRLYDDLRRSYTELSRAQAEVVRHERLAALGEVAAVMAHEVRNPLGVIFNSLTSLKKMLEPRGDVELLLRIMGEEAERLNRIVGDLLDFARPYSPERKALALDAVVVSAVQAASGAMGASATHFVTEFPAALPEVALDGHLVKQALVNLVVNAVQSMPRGGTVTVRALIERDGPKSWARISVTDQGPGISPQAVERIFQPFFTTKATGTGLGLAVVKRIVEAQQGEVLLDTGPAGTTFTMRLPLQ